MGKKKQPEPIPSKTATKIIEEVVESMCGSYCKWPIIWDQREGELCDSEICANCPLNRL